MQKRTFTRCAAALAVLSIFGVPSAQAQDASAVVIVYPL
jgi:hypothetical protein